MRRVYQGSSQVDCSDRGHVESARRAATASVKAPRQFVVHCGLPVQHSTGTRSSVRRPPCPPSAYGPAYLARLITIRKDRSPARRAVVIPPAFCTEICRQSVAQLYGGPRESAIHATQRSEQRTAGISLSQILVEETSSKAEPSKTGLASLSAGAISRANIEAITATRAGAGIKGIDAILLACRVLAMAGVLLNDVRRSCDKNREAAILSNPRVTTPPCRLSQRTFRADEPKMPSSLSTCFARVPFGFQTLSAEIGSVLNA